MKLSWHSNLTAPSIGYTLINVHFHRNLFLDNSNDFLNSDGQFQALCKLRFLLKINVRLGFNWSLDPTSGNAYDLRLTCTNKKITCAKSSWLVSEKWPVLNYGHVNEDENLIETTQDKNVEVFRHYRSHICSTLI